MEESQRQLILSLLAYGVQRGISPLQLCKPNDINLSSLKKGSHPPLTHSQWNGIWQKASELSNDPLFGLHFGESLQLSALGIVGEIIKTSATVGEAVTHAASLTHLVTNLFTVEVMSSKKSFKIVLNPAGEKQETVSFQSRQMADLLIVFIIHELDGFLLEKITPLSVTLPYTKDESGEYERVLRCRPSLKKNEYSMELKASYWSEQIITANYELQRFLLHKVTPVYGKLTSTDFQKKIHSYLLNNAYLGIPSLEEVAANFNITPRTLQRKLQEEGITFNQLSDDIRKSLALHYLQSGNYLLKEISNMLGYNELSAFSRAFKRWTGKPPVLYQKD